MDVITFASAKKASEKHTENYVGDTLAGSGFLKGKSVYEIAVENGYTGSEKQWLEDLKGKTGPQGPQGPKGEDYTLTKKDKEDIADIVIETLTDFPEGGGGLTEVSWEDIKDKPFEEISAGQIITWDGNVNGLPVIEKQVEIDDDMMAQFNLYKVSDTIITKERANGYNIGLYTPEGELEIITDFIKNSGNGIFYTTSKDMQVPLVFVCSQAGNTMDINIDGIEFSVTLPETGVWFMAQLYEGQMLARVTSFEIPAEIKTLDIKYLPKNMALGYEVKGEGIYWDGNTEGLTEVAIEFEEDGALIRMMGCKVSDETPSIDEIIGKQFFIYDGYEEYSDTIIEDGVIVFADNGSYFVGEGLNIIICLDDNTVFPLMELVGIGEDIVIPEAGIWFMQLTADGAIISQTISLRSPDTFVTIDEKFIPDTIARKSELDSVSAALSNYYIKSQVYNKNEVYNMWQIDDKLRNLNVDLSDYYTKNETYSKNEVYTKTEIDTALDNVDLSDYYTKTEIDSLIGDVETILNEINALIGG